jgi:hypothetical protein
MKLPPDSLIAPEKLSSYLLVRLPKGDKSSFLALAGYTLQTATKLGNDLRSQVLPQDAAPLHRTQHGQYYEIRAPLIGPNGRTLHVRTIWITEHLSGITKFVTLIPDKTHR